MKFEDAIEEKVQQLTDQAVMNYSIKKVHISTINVGDIVEHDGVLMTVGANNIPRS